MHCSKKRVFVGIFLIIMAFIGMISYPLVSMRVSAAEDYRKWRQADPRWGSINLGSEGQSMAKYGCLVTSIAIMAAHSGSKNPDNFNPGTLAQSLNAVNCFSYGAIASWAKVTEALPEVKFAMNYTFSSGTQSGKASEMKKLYDSGYYMICNVGNHWVFIEKIDGSEVYMIDPAKDDTKLFSSYPLASISELRVFTAKYPPQSIPKPQPSTSAPTTKPTSPPTTVTEAPKWKLGEYYVSDKLVNILSEPNPKALVLENVQRGCIVRINNIDGSYGSIQLGAETCWIDMKCLTYAGEHSKHMVGDINDDKKVDRLDLALLNEYLMSLSELPDGISYLRDCEIAAADLNSDGIVDNNDVLKYLSIICM